MKLIAIRIIKMAALAGTLAFVSGCAPTVTGIARVPFVHPHVMGGGYFVRPWAPFIPPSEIFVPTPVIEVHAEVAKADSQPAGNTNLPEAVPSTQKQQNNATGKSVPTSPAAPAEGESAPLSVDDVKTMSAAGVKGEVIVSEIEKSKSVYSKSDIAAVQQPDLKIDPTVIDCMSHHVKE